MGFSHSEGNVLGGLELHCHCLFNQPNILGERMNALICHLGLKRKQHAVAVGLPLWC